MTTTIPTTTKTVALALLDRAVAERGADFVYQEHYGATCLYWRDPDGPACLIGVGLSYLDLPVATLSDAMPDLLGFDAASNPVFGSSPDDFVEVTLYRGTSQLPTFKITEAAARVLWAAQVWQDGGATWGEARDFARTVADLIEED